ncbi:MAG: hypothetical protein NZ992_08490, partial [Candidatus Korarchaeum sp.]|nr:hypothetical protein [Candidatus Korarchaeum sp.]MDW8035994.1 hypothetical protein [Candidatus Korarchaeum sp.]
MDLKCFDRIRLHELRVKGRGISVNYELTIDGVTKEYKLIETYEDIISDVKGIREIAALISIVPVINYSLFTDEILIDFPIHELDLRFLKDMSEVTARDIFVNRIVKRTGLVKEEFLPDPEEVRPEQAEPRAEVNAKTTDSTELEAIDGEGSCGVMVSG